MRVLITGASSGIGLELAKQYLLRGSEVIACGRDLLKLKAAFAGWQSALPDFCTFDQSNLPQVKEQLGKHNNLDLVILNAGTCEYIDDALNFDSTLFARVIETNVIGTAHCLSAVLPNVSSGGRLALVSSTVTLLPLTRAEAYGASKAALDYLAKSLAIDLTQHNIYVSLVAPGFVDTPLTKANDFAMPGLISVEQAAEKILKGLAKGKQTIAFPARFYWPLKAMTFLPEAMWRKIATKMVKASG